MIAFQHGGKAVLYIVPVALGFRLADCPPGIELPKACQIIHEVIATAGVKVKKGDPAIAVAVIDHEVARAVVIVEQAKVIGRRGQ